MQNQATKRLTKFNTVHVIWSQTHIGCHFFKRCPKFEVYTGYVNWTEAYIWTFQKNVKRWK